MIRHLLLLLSLLVALPVSAPATAACHAPESAAMAHHGGDHDPAPARPRPQHQCLGCVPPDTLAGGAVASPIVPRAPLVAGAAARLAPDPAHAPVPPPPRAG